MDPRSAKMFVLVDLAILMAPPILLVRQLMAPILQILLTDCSQNTSAIFGEDSPK